MTKIRIPVHVRSRRPDRRVGAPVSAHVETASQEWAARAPDAETRDRLPHEAQARAAQDTAAQACEGQENLLEDVLSIADDLERALAASDDGTPIREGVAITHRGVLHILRKHGIERVEAEAQPFDPRWH